MKANIQHARTKKSWLNRPHYEFQESYSAPNEDVANLTEMRRIQNIRALAAEAEYLRSKVRFHTLQIEFQQLKSHILGRLNEIQADRNISRQQLKSDSQSISTLRCWHGMEEKMNRDIDRHHSQLIDSHQAVQQSEDAMKQAAVHNLYVSRRFSKFDEILKILHDDMS
ncbi:hypothetical protein [Limnohabitans sp. 2KL-17]|uniref:hypothetical protein n=1 Tax=Limnohabitans sp. 2KL-17 TaxID=1100704 RepID=UPI0011B21B14|nr:hypothetical protein [Limnohabitans sp. 2KL-17]